MVDNPLGGCREDAPLASVPDTVSLPAEPSGLRIDGADYGDGGGTYRWDGGEDVSPCESVERIHTEGIDEVTLTEGLRTVARWYNYAVPNFVFGQEMVGVWGDTGSYSFPAPDRVPERTLVTRSLPDHYLVQAGIPRQRDERGTTPGE